MYFWIALDNTKPLLINENIKHRDAVTVLGYPIGGNAISTTTGVISRIEYRIYVWSQEYLPAIQIDAAINSGNSGGPAVNDKGELVGIAMMKLKGTSNIAYIVPSIIINTFLKDIKDGKVDGLCKDTTVINHIENEQLKNYYGLQNGNGVLVTYTDIYEKDLKVDDIILSIDNKDIANNGTIQSQFGRIDFQLSLHTKQIGDIVKLKVLRNKKTIDINYTIKRQTPLINREFNKEPRYIIFGGLVFTPITKNYLQSIGMKDKAVDMLFYKENKSEDFTEPVAWMQTIFPHNVNRGYFSGADVVKKVNGIKIKNFKHFVNILDNLKSEFVVIDFLERKKVVLSIEEARKSFKDLKSIYYLNIDRRVEVGFSTIYY